MTVPTVDNRARRAQLTLRRRAIDMRLSPVIAREITVRRFQPLCACRQAFQRLTLRAFADAREESTDFSNDREPSSPTGCGSARPPDRAPGEMSPVTRDCHARANVVTRPASRRA